MVRYTGRAKTRTGSVNTNQLGLKMSGCPSTVGKPEYIYQWKGHPMIKDIPDMVIGANPAATLDSDLWKTIVEQAPTEADGLIAGTGTGFSKPSYTIIGNSCTL